MATKLPEISDHAPPPEPRPEDLNPPPPRRRRRFAPIIWLLVLGVAGFIGYRIYQSSQQAEQPPAGKRGGGQGNRAVSVVVAPVRTGDVPVILRGLGTVTPQNT